MNYPVQIQTTPHELILNFRTAEELLRWHAIRAICSGDAHQRIFGIELFLYELTDLDVEPVEEQFVGCDNIEGLDDGLLYVYLRDKQAWQSHGWGFGRVGMIGITEQGAISTIRIPWIEVGAGTPVADPHRALAGLPFTQCD